MMRQTCFLAGLLLSCSILKAQDSTLTLNLVPNSPEASAFTKSTSMPMTLYEGQPNISVPVYDLKTTKLDVPITLSYNRSADRPGETATWVGLGWNLAAGGAITREIKGQLDGSSWMQQFGTCMGTNSSGHVNADYDDCADPSAIAESFSNPQDYLTELAKGRIDGQPDIYMFNFAGYSGKFILIQGRAYLFPVQDLQITQNSGGSFTIITPDGTSYNFGGVETSYPLNKMPGGSQVPSYYSSWRLTGIVSPDRSDQITFAYTSTEIEVPNNVPQTFVAYSPTGYQGIPSNSFSASTFQMGGTTISTLFLSDIYTSEEHVHFTADTNARKDMPSVSGYVGIPALSSVQVYNQFGQLVRNVQLYHDYFGDTANYQCKLRLDSVVVTGNDTLNKEKYSFQYTTNNVGLPNSLGIDMWGYYNGDDNNASLFDCSTLNLASDPNFPGCGSRASNGGDYGLLDEITYPTGGYATISYQQNTIYDGLHYIQVQESFTKNDTCPNGDDSHPESETFTLEYAQNIMVIISRGRPFERDFTQIGSIVNDGNDSTVFEGMEFVGPQTDTIGSVTDTMTLPAGTYTINLNVDNTIDTTTSVSVYYSENGPVIEGAPGPGMRVSQIDYYSDDTAQSPARVQQFIYTTPQGLSTGGVLEGPGYGINQVSVLDLPTDAPYTGALQNINYFQTTYSSNSSPGLNPLMDQQFFYSEVTEINHDVNGDGETQYFYNSLIPDLSNITLVEQVTYKFSSGQLIPLKSTYYHYSDTGLVYFNGVTPLQTDKTVGYPYSMGQEGTISALPAVDSLLVESQLFSLYGSAISSYWSLWLRLDSTDEFDYDTTGANPVQHVTQFYYRSPNHFQVTMKRENDSKGDTIITQYTYPLDCPVIADPTVRSVDSTFYVAKQQVYNNYVDWDLTRYELGNAYGDTAAYYAPWTLNSNSTKYNDYIDSLILDERNKPCEFGYATAFQQATHSRDSSIQQYFSDLASAIVSGHFTYTQTALMTMQQNHLVSEPITETVTLLHAGTTTLLSSRQNEYFTNGLGSVSLDTVWETELSAPMPPATFNANPSAYYVPEESYLYNPNGRLATEYAIHNYHRAYLWDYEQTYPIAQVLNADTASIAYTSFEADGSGNWIIPDTARDRTYSMTGTMSYDLNGSNAIVKPNLNSGTTYVVGYWSTGGAMNVNGTADTAGTSVTIGGTTWTYYEHKVTGATTITVSGTGTIDELRLFPLGSLMTTYTYDPTIGVTSECSPTNYILYYAYDDLGRLANVKDLRGNIIKTYNYHYQQQ